MVTTIHDVHISLLLCEILLIHNEIYSEMIEFLGIYVVKGVVELLMGSWEYENIPVYSL